MPRLLYDNSMPISPAMRCRSIKKSEAEYAASPPQGYPPVLRSWLHPSNHASSHSGTAAHLSKKAAQGSSICAPGPSPKSPCKSWQYNSSLEAVSTHPRSCRAAATAAGAAATTTASVSKGVCWPAAAGARGSASVARPSRSSHATWT